tara:strand:- start:1039 stop:1686 length:648 start_codon:yes stop_codon:yes gene_type:complete
MKKNGLIIIGGNSKLISKFLNNNLYSLYQKIIIISHRKYNGNDDYEIIEFLNPKLIKTTLEKILLNKKYYFDLIVSNTPTQNIDFKNEKTLEWGKVAIDIMNTSSINKLVRKLIYTGSCLPLLPIYHNSLYKKIKNSEMKNFVKLWLNNNQKGTYIILPPLKYKNTKKLNLIFDYYEKWALKLKEELSLNNSIVYPNGFVGIVTKVLFFIKFGKL